MLKIHWREKVGALLVLLAVSAVARSQGETLQIGERLPLANADFEKGTDGWTVVEKVPMTRCTGDAAHGGKMGLRVMDGDEKFGSSALSSVVPAQGGQGCRVTFWAKATVDGAAGGNLMFFDAARRNIPGYQPGAVLQKSDNWTQYRFLARAPLGANSLKVWVHSFSSAKTVADLDDFVVETASGAAIDTLPVPVPPTADPSARLRRSPPYIILKLDDLVSAKGRVYGRWQKVADFLRGRGIKASIGIICDSLEGDNPEYLSWIKTQHASGLIEFWNHGYDHKTWQEDRRDFWEFKGPSYEQQKAHLARSEQLAREKLGFPLATFGSPFNQTDANTVRALAEIDDLKILLYADSQNLAGKTDLNRVGEVNIENPLFVPSLERFIAGYNRYPDRAYFVIQGHPQQWDDARFDQFAKIVDFLVAQKAIFTTPSEYVQLKNQSATDRAAP